MKANPFFAATVALAFFLSGCAGLNLPTTPQEPREAFYTAATFAQLPGWGEDALQDFSPALLRSCETLLKRDDAATVAPTTVGGRVADWRAPCHAVQNATPAALRTTIEQYFIPFRVTAPGQESGLFTGYFEKELRGSLTKTARYNVPLYTRPPELVTVDLGLFRPKLKGERIAGKVENGNLLPFADRAAIDAGALAGRHLELAWVDDADAAFFLHVQGSGRVTLENGQVLRIGYDGQNGHVYYAIGKELVARGELTPETISLQTINAWLKAHPSEAASIRAKNPSYIFFKTLDGEGPIGAQGIALTPARSLAVDPRFTPYGAPVWLVLGDNKPMHRLVVAQDTGGAIRGPVRGDFFWGAGNWAETNAGDMKATGQMWVLLPRTLSGNKHVVLPQ